ncbi:hypothetical protein B0H19DRAFT_1265694 [Mycena capillaripes]|nr:hypothetical protein B0H19DRAFT_1265694 [Mycena capillaripes]
MPKSVKTPVKSRPKPRPVRTAKKSVSLVDDEAEESDDGVLLERPDFEAPEEYPDVHENEDRRESDNDFINDGDPYEDEQECSPSPDITPPPSPSKRGRTRRSVKNPVTPVSPIKSRLRRAATPPETPSPTKRSKRLNKTEDIIELASSSEEDLEAMDLDDSMYKKPTSIKPTALPPSLLTRSAASKEKLSPDSRIPPGNGAPMLQSGSQNLFDPSDLDGIPEELRVPPFVVDGKITKSMIGWISAMASHKMDSASLTEGPGLKHASRALDRVDHDQLALDEGIRSSILQASSPKISKKPSVARYSPDWEPLSVADLLEEAASRSAAKKELKSVIRTTSNTDSADGNDTDLGETPPNKHTSRARPSQKGKEKAKSDSSETVIPSVSPLKPIASKGSARVRSENTSKSSGISAPKAGDENALGVKNSADVSSFMLPPKPLSAASLAVPAAGNASLTMAQLLRMSRGEPLIEDDAEAKEPTPPIEPDQVFLEDLESYKAYFDSDAPCGVFELQLQDPALRPHYVGLHPLPKRRRIVPVYDRTRSSLEDIDWTTGGRVKFSSWFDQNPRMLAANSMSAMLFQSAEPNFINLSRVSPLDLTSRASAGSSQTSRLYVGDRIAICLSAVCCTESHVLAPKRIGPKTELQRKWFSGVLHDQDWERFESILCLVFGESIMYGQVTDKSISFQTMMSPDPSRAEQSNDKSAQSVPSTMFSARSPSKKVPRYTDKMLLAYNDPIPVYDARKTVFDFSADLDRLDKVLPLFPGEVPAGSFTVVGYTCSSYRRAITGSTGQVPHVGLNILWLIVFGTPGIRSSHH